MINLTVQLFGYAYRSSHKYFHCVIGISEYRSIIIRLPPSGLVNFIMRESIASDTQLKNSEKFNILLIISKAMISGFAQNKLIILNIETSG